MSKLAIFLGGIGYHCDKPLLYYAREVAYENGYTEYVNIDYEVKVKIAPNEANAMQKVLEIALVQAEEKMAQINWEKYDDILFVSKSIGTAVASAYMKNHADFLEKKHVKNVYLTPLDIMFEYQPANGIAFFGTKDAWIELENMKEKCVSKGIKLNIIPDTNHSLEGDDLWKNMDILKEVMLEIHQYLKEA